MVDVTSICNQALAAIGTRTTITSLAEASNEARQCLLQYEPTKRHLLRAAHWGFARTYAKLTLGLARRGTPENPTGSEAPFDPERPPSPPTIWDEGHEPPPPWLYAYAPPHRYLAMRYILPASATGVISPPMFGTAQTTFYPEQWMGPMTKFEMANIQGSLVGIGGIGAVILSNMPQAIACYTSDIDDPSLFDESFTRALVQGLAANLCQTLTGDLKLVDALFKMTNSLVVDARVKSANEGLATIDVMPDWFRTRGLGPSVGTGPWVAEYGPLFGGVS